MYDRQGFTGESLREKMNIVFAIIFIVLGCMYVFFPEKGLKIHRMHVRLTHLYENTDRMTARKNILRLFGFVLICLGLSLLVFL